MSTLCDDLVRLEAQVSGTTGALGETLTGLVLETALLKTKLAALDPWTSADPWTGNSGPKGPPSGNNGQPGNNGSGGFGVGGSGVGGPPGPHGGGHGGPPGGRADSQLYYWSFIAALSQLYRSFIAA